MDPFILVFVIIISCVTIANRAAKFFLLFYAILVKRTKSKNYESEVVQHGRFPRIAVHVPISNEDSQIVLKTLRSLKKLEYQNYIVIIIDNNTEDESLWQPVKTYCDKNADLFKFYHVGALKDYKAGALNYALEKTPEDVELIAIVDSDNKVSPRFLKDTYKYFDDEKVAFVQTPLGFKNDPNYLRFESWIFLIYRYFLSVYMPATNRFKCSPFIGSMGVVRKKHLEQVGGWKGVYLTEDMEISYRFFAKGYYSHFVNRAYGFSMPPSDLRNFKKQHFRWNFGNTQILKNYLIKGFTDKWPGKHSSIRKIAYFSCPGIYLNFYFIPFILVLIIMLYQQMFGMSSFYLKQISVFIFLVVMIEITGEFVFFLTVGKFEKTNLVTVLKNLISWYSLSLNNSRSTYAALFKKTMKFEITEKANKMVKRENQILIPELILAIALFLILFLAILKLEYQLTNTMVLISLFGIISFVPAMLPKLPKESGD